eukprot:12039800-Prorocentrum_lima.AAC.1
MPIRPERIGRPEPEPRWEPLGAPSFLTEQGERQTAKRKAAQQAIGKEHVTKKRPNRIAPGNDDC